jgi:hypothetical protein
MTRDQYKKAGGAAFPTIMENADDDGMTLRDYFAAKALQGMLCNGFMPDQVSQPSNETYDYTRAAYQLADAMLKAREA